MGKVRIVLYCLLLFFIQIAAEELKISIIIPCHFKHAGLLYDLLKIYTQQTVLPYEVVISISQAASMDPSIPKEIRATQWPFNVRMLLSDKVQYPGLNRNIACNNAKGDIFILNDADDIPHPQRNEIIQYFFKQYRCEHLAHQFIYVEEEKNIEDFFTKYTVHELSYVNPRDYRSTWEGKGIHNGNIAISPRVFSQQQWLSKKDATDDTIFNAHVYELFTNRIVVHAPLILYRNYLSTLGNDFSAIISYEKHYAGAFERYKTMLPLNGFQVRDY